MKTVENHINEMREEAQQGDTSIGGVVRCQDNTAQLIKLPDNAEIAAALCKAQQDMDNAKLNKTNPHFKSKFADLVSIRDASLKTMTKNGLSICQYTRIDDGNLVLVTRLQHSSGQFLEGEYPLPNMVNDPQKMGSALTYARRYCWAAMLGISADEDDDANAAQNADNSRMRSKDDPNWTGPLNKTTLKAAVREAGSEIMACTDSAQLEAYLASKEYRDIADQCMSDLPSFYYGDGGDSKGLGGLVAQMRTTLDQAET